ncbi:MAG: HAD hydrolase family protein [Gammaproteobacteria bacterium]|nr:HAD hydrolase family protein [Gammaproteobacteria bacterium]MYF30033.1 HAD hydrolase family protein [Gammaproteobacteria bacterium]MYK46307.1 HAD hydrolase family protein [Gammaproteobacteria bacterium]
MAETPVPNEVLRRLRNVRLLGLDVDGVLTDGRLYYGPDNVELKAFNTQDGSAMQRLMASGVPIAIVTGRTSEAVARRATELGVPYFFDGVADKLATLDELARRTGIAVNHMAFAGDDLADLAVFGHVGVSIGVVNAHPDVVRQADYVTANRGGYGAVREICDLVIAARSS